MKTWVAFLLIAIGTGCTRPPQPAHWRETAESRHPDINFVCDVSGQIIATVMQDSAGTFSVFGGDGSGYGVYANLVAAKKRAENITRDRGLISNLNHCREY